MTGVDSPSRVTFPELVTDLWELRLTTAAGTELVGVSLAALTTAFATPQYRAAVDIGRCSALLTAQDTALLTHCHSDHIAGLIAWLSARSRRQSNRPTTVVVPEEKRGELLAALAAWPDLDGVRRRIDLDRTFIGAGPGTTIDLDGGAVATAFAVRHNTAALGWTIAAADERRPLFAFAGDGTIEPFRDDPSLLDAEVAVVDCSFIEPGTRVAARLGGHAHIADWLELLPDLACDHLVLAHLQPGAGAADVLERLPEPLPGTATVVPWVAAPGRRR